MKKLLVILGPTATGKTGLALKLAAQFSGEIIACDSRQVYRELNIGTGKLAGSAKTIKVENGLWRVNGVAIHLYDLVDLDQQFSVKDYVQKAIEAIDQVVKKNKLPIVVGGTGHYLKGLLQGFASLQSPVDQKLRGTLQKLAVSDLQARLKNISESKWNSLNSSDQQNSRRLIRAIELSVNIKHQANSGISLAKKYQVLKIGLCLPRDLHYQKINQTVDKWLQAGIVDEVNRLKNKGVSTNRLREIGLNYRVLADFLEGKMSLDDLPEKIKQQVRNYAKRQVTWFRKEPAVNWFDVSQANWPAKVEKLIKLWYHDSGKIYGQQNRYLP